MVRQSACLEAVLVAVDVGLHFRGETLVAALAGQQHIDRVVVLVEVVLLFLQLVLLMLEGCLLYTSPSPRDLSTSRMPSSA